MIILFYTYTAFKSCSIYYNIIYIVKAIQEKKKQKFCIDQYSVYRVYLIKSFFENKAIL